MYWNKSDLKYFQKIKKNVLLRKEKYYRKKLHINGHEKNVKIMVLKTRNDIENEINGYNNLPNDVIFVIFHKLSFDFNQLEKKSDVIITDKENKVTTLFRSRKIEEVYKDNDFFNVWIASENFIKFYEISTGDKIGTT